MDKSETSNLLRLLGDKLNVDIAHTIGWDVPSLEAKEMNSDSGHLKYARESLDRAIAFREKAFGRVQFLMRHKQVKLARQFLREQERQWGSDE